jgi:hypothetical protein
VHFADDSAPCYACNRPPTLQCVASQLSRHSRCHACRDELRNHERLPPRGRASVSAIRSRDVVLPSLGEQSFAEAARTAALSRLLFAAPSISSAHRTPCLSYWLESVPVARWESGSFIIPYHPSIIEFCCLIVDECFKQQTLRWSHSPVCPAFNRSSALHLAKSRGPHKELELPKLSLEASQFSAASSIEITKLPPFMHLRERKSSYIVSRDRVIS